MNPQDLARWMRAEHERTHELLRDVEEKVAVVPRTNQHKWIQDLRWAFEHLRAHLMKHFALEEQNGYMVSVVEHQPALAHEVERLAHEHAEIARIMTRIHEDIQSLKPEDGLLIRDCCRRSQDLIAYIEHHGNAENVLLLSAFTNDIGTKD